MVHKSTEMLRKVKTLGHIYFLDGIKRKHLDEILFFWGSVRQKMKFICFACCN